MVLQGMPEGREEGTRVKIAKRLMGKTLLRVCELAPAMKPWLRFWGLRAWPAGLEREPVTIQGPNGKTFKLTGLSQSYLSFTLFWRGAAYYEPITTLVAMALIRPGDTFLDVGAGLGFHTLALTAHEPGIRAIAFEPNPQQFHRLRENVRANQLHQVCCEALVLADADGAVVLYLVEPDRAAAGQPGAGSGRAARPLEPAPASTVKVPALTLDSYLNRCYLPGRMLLRVSAEAQSWAFFQGARQTLAARKPDVILETAGRWEDQTAGALKQAGYRFYSITDKGLQETATISGITHDRWHFSHHLLSPRPRRQIAAVDEELRPRIERLDLTQTIQGVDSASLQGFKPPPQSLHSPSRMVTAH